ncbi:MAG: hypothetical protein IT438_02170 [Phycisphaerales bacterium]|nr:hypothetical protein [Phycisphaerales bacterium]
MAVLLCALGAEALAQISSIRYAPPVRYGQRPPVGEMEDEAEDDDEQMMMGRGGRGPGEDQPPKPKTPLGRYIFTLDFTRTPETVLKARAKLAADAREEVINPPDTSDDDKPDQPDGAVPSDDSEGGGVEVGGIGEDPEAVRAMIAAAMSRAEMGQPGAAAPGGDVPSVATDAEKTKPKKLTKGERRAADKFRLHVVAGHWPDVKAFLTEKAGEDSAALYQHILTRLAGDSAIVPDEILYIADASPGELTDKQITSLGQMLKAAVARGADPGHVGLMLRKGTSHFGGTEPASRQRAASLLMAAGLPVEAQPFLDPLEQARKDENAKLLNLHAMYFQGLAARKADQGEKSATIRKCWDLCLEVLALPKAPAAERSAAIGRALGFIEQVPEEVGDAWMRGLFEGGPDLGWALVEKANNRARNAKAQMRPVEDRVKALRRLKRIGTAIVESAGERLPQYGKALDMMALSIVDELEFTKQMQQMPQQNREDERVQVVPSEQLTECLPSAAWLRAGDAGLAARLELMTAGVAGGSGDIDGVLEMVRPLVAVDKERAQKIADSVIAAWPNYAQGGRSGYEEEYAYNMYGRARYYGGAYYGGYGGGGYDGGIPLTRAKQKRFLEQLGTLLAEFRKAGLKQASPSSLVAAFSASHSQAEVFDPADIAAVFGPIKAIPPQVTIELCDTMRKRLGSIWRNARVQQEAGTKRNDRQIAAEVIRGYDVAAELAEAALAGEPGSWRAAVLMADLRFDKAEFLYGQKVELATYAGLREQAFSGYQAAADLYVADLRAGKAQPSSLVYSHWVASALGASDLGFLTRQDQPDDNQVDRVVAAINRLPDAMRDRHIGLFAKEITNSLQTLAPELKVRFLTNACRVIGEHPEGAAVRKTLAYYNDLKTEVELVLAVSGETTVGSKEPFGVTLAVWSTRAVSRESGGFGKYIQNQQYHPMTGQPVDYKDELEKKIREALSERFEVVSVTFNKPNTPPMGVARDGGGWEQHPLAFIMLRAKDASVDRIPPIRMDLDFTDGRGYVMLPVATTVQLIDARVEPRRALPDGLEIEQTLDARAMDHATAKLDVRAVAAGVIPPISDLLDLTPITSAGIRITRTDDHGLTITDLDTSGDAVVPKCERTWTIELAAAADREGESFTFPTLVANSPRGIKLTNKQYADADIVACAASVPIRLAAPASGNWVVVLVGGVALFLGAILAWRYRTKRTRATAAPAPAFTVPEHLTPISAVALLQRIATVPDLSLAENERRDLTGAIQEIELKFFGPANGTHTAAGDTQGLRTMVERWVGLASARVRA